MSQRPSSSKIAGTLAILLAAGVGAYYLQQRQPPAATPATSPAPPAAAAAKPSATKRDKNEATTALMDLPELVAWSAHIERTSGGAAHGGLIEYEPTLRVVDGKSYWQFSFVENSAEAAHRWESFLVATDSDEILVEDTANDELLSLERWRRDKQPMQRIGAAPR